MYIHMPIKAVPKARPRFAPFTNTVYTPLPTKKFEATVGIYAKNYVQLNEFDIEDITEKGVSVDIVFYVQIPKRWSKKKVQEALSGEIRPVSKPDADNVVKSILDGLNGILYKDDSYVTEHSCKKFYALEPSIEVSVNYL